MEPQRVGRYLDKLKLANKLKAKFGDLDFNITVRLIGIPLHAGLSTDSVSDQTRRYDLPSA